MSEPHGFCRCCVGFLFSLGLTALLLWLSFRPRLPRYFVVDFRLPAIANLTGEPPNSNVSFVIEIENKNKELRIYYDPLNVTIACGNKSRSVTMQGFHQGHDKTADKYETIDARWVPWSEVAGKEKAVFHVWVESKFRYKALLWKGRHHWLRLGADVEVGEDGRKTRKKGIRLKSSAAPPPSAARCDSVVAAPILAVVVAVIVLPQPLVRF